MTADYRLGAGNAVQRTADGVWIPNDLGNRDWQDYLVWLAVPNTPDPLPAPSADDIYAGKTGDGLTITSQAAPTLTATYAIDFPTQQNIIGIVASIAAGAGLPMGAATIPWPDTRGLPHNFTAEQFKAFAAAVRDYVFGLRQTWGALKAGLTIDWPSPSVSIP